MLKIDDIQEIIDTLIKFRNERDWKQFHDNKNLTTEISIEAEKLNELFSCKDVADSADVNKNEITEERADILGFSFLLAEKTAII